MKESHPISKRKQPPLISTQSAVSGQQAERFTQDGSTMLTFSRSIQCSGDVTYPPAPDARSQLPMPRPNKLHLLMANIKINSIVRFGAEGEFLWEISG